ncbi:AAA domain-containing protein [Desulfuribacillus alkaliarsenatis]|uniref:DNA helicase n=1 Tax=Desulfuribacillus alkaliarsenatis TaxID=766136 RepID=A0A1E5G0U7_9FIRM|nr:AAA domain-containing protein [Desulfuribacillus alkaliarsenatis]OEF96359.1 DNA helicase [Desulfuribacillus alkaliarsenatis]
MDIEKHLILVKGEDKTEAISHCEKRDGQWHIQFQKGKTYTYNYNNVQWFSNPQLLDTTSTLVYENEQPLSGIQKIINFVEYIRICFISGYKKLYTKDEITIERSLNDSEALKILEYLKKAAEKISVGDEEENSFLYKQYNSLQSISPRSVLATYLKPKELKRSSNPQTPIFPFGFNLSQKEATEKAINEHISIIEGPPGTGKTQTILNILANAVMNDKTVAIVSNNNAATANVIEKLHKYGVDFIAAYLGNNENKTKFITGQSGAYPDMRSWAMDDEYYQSLQMEIEENSKELNEMLAIKNNVAKLKHELSVITVEKEYFDKYFNDMNELKPYRSLYEHTSDKVLALCMNYLQLEKQGVPLHLLQKIKYFFSFGIFNFSFFNNQTEDIIGFLQNYFYELKILELKKQISKFEERLERYHFNKAMKKYSEDSMRLFKAKLAKMYANIKERPMFTSNFTWKGFEAFIDEYPVIMSTTHSLRNCANKNYLFDYVIMDEASQVDIVSGALALSCAKNAVIVGDLMQLPNVVPNEVAEETDRIFNTYNLNEVYRYSNHSMLSSVANLIEDVPKTLLREHYRCHPKIIGFCNQKYYNNGLVILTEEANQDKPLVVYKTVKGNHARGTYNQRQIDVIVEEIIPEQIGDDTNQSIGIISPYRMQVTKLSEHFDSKNIEIDTVHKYQGREKDTIIISTVVNEINDFVDNPNLVNVAISRAVKKLIIVVSDNDKNDNSNIGDLIKYIKYNNFEIINSKVYSVFDLLYHCYSEQLRAIMKTRKNVSKYQSEILIDMLIEKVLSQDKYRSLEYVMHVPLKMLLRDTNLLNERERHFASNVLTHTDFVIFNRLDKMPVLVVEVDGYKFHDQNPEQLKRDQMKDTILEKYGIPILRLKTNESQEEVRLENKLHTIHVG